VKPRPPLPPGPYLVLGLGRSGVAAALALKARGEEVAGADTGSPDVGRLIAAGVEVHLDGSGIDLAAGRARTVVKSPGIPPDAPQLAAALAGGAELLGELELGWRLVPNAVIAVTGTNGKTTTTEWIGHIHAEAGSPAVVAGNVGVALSSLAGSADPEATIVCEASSFQLADATAFAPEVAVLVNLDSDHLPWHGSQAAYVAAKLRIFANQGNDDVAVVPDDLGIEDIGGCARELPFGSTPRAEVAERAGTIWWADEPLLGADEIALPGAHNRQNALAAAAACLARGIEPDAVRAGLRSFAGVPHRLERVAEHAGVRYVNDSKATNVASAIVALEAFGDPIHLILGGDGKSQDFGPLAGPVARHCAGVYLIGAAAGDLRAALEPSGVPLSDCGDLARAVAEAAQAARSGEVVLLSPACASYDQYGDFEERGEHFRRLVRGLA
jgi:UDP-N-acetylmuramoylalanine--D-glutamate ligase